MPQSLEVLIERTSRGDREAFATFYDLTVVPAWRLARLVEPDDEKAEELLVAAYLVAWTEAAGCPASGRPPLTWLLWLVQATGRPGSGTR